MAKKKKGAGSTLAEILIAVAAIGLVSSMLVVRGNESNLSDKQAILRADLKALREAIARYYQDHGFFPCSEQDANRAGDPVTFRRQLTWYTDETGRVSPVADSTFRYGPYLRAFPANPLSSSPDPESTMHVTVDTVHTWDFQDLLSGEVSDLGSSGWYYVARTGQIIPTPASRDALAELLARDQRRQETERTAISQR